MKVFKTFLIAVIAIGTMSVSVKKTTIVVHAENTIQMNRMYNPNSGEHFYTASEAEKENLLSKGWGDEGIGWEAPETGNPVYRLYNPNSGDHHYTLNWNEMQMLTGKGWIYEGIGWYSETASKSYPLYREYNPNAFSGTHNYTLSSYENSFLESKGWGSEGVGWYAATGNNSMHAVTYSFTPIVYTTPVFYNQKDPSWSGFVYNGNTLGNTGCGVTSLAMILTTRLGRQVLPTEVADYLYSVGLFNGSIPGTNGASNVQAGNHFGVTCQPIASEDSFVSALNNGKLISFQTVGYPFSPAGTSHNIVVYSDGASIHVLDPLDGGANGTYSADTIWSHQTNVATDLDQGAPGFAF